MRFASPRLVPALILALLFTIPSTSSLPAQLHTFTYPPPPEGPFSDPATGRTYIRIAELLHYFEGHRIAQWMGGHLVAIQDAAEQQWLLATFGSPSADTGIGMRSLSGTPVVWAWESGEPVSFTDWAPGQPAPFSGYCAKGLEEWQSVSFNQANRMIVESAVPFAGELPGFACAFDPPNVVLTWGANSFDTVRIYRNEQLIATVPANVGFHADGGQGTSSRYVAVAEGSAGFSLPARCNCNCPYFELEVGTVAEIHPGPVEVPVTLDHPVLPVQSFSLGLCYDTSVLEVTAVVPGAAVLAAVPGGVDFFEVFYDTGGFGLFMLPCALAPFCVIPAGWDHEVIVATFEALAPPPIHEDLVLCSTIGQPPYLTFVSYSGAGYPPFLTHGSVTLGLGGFIRGDGNYDGTVDIADVLFLGEQLFGPGAPFFPCQEACEVNGDGAIDIADMVFTLSYLFSGSTSPGAPFPDCESDPAPAGGFPCDPGAPCP